MPYIGRGPAKSGAFRILDDVSGSFNGSTVTFALTVASTALTVGLPETLIIAVDGVIQEPGSAFTISGSNIVFGSAPQAAATFWGVELGDVGGLATIANDSIVEAKLDVSNGPTNDYFLQAQSGEGGGLTWAAAGGTITREGGQTTAATTTSTSAVDLLSASSLTIATTQAFYFTVNGSKTSGSATIVGHGLKVNSTVVGDSATGAQQILGFWSTGTNQGEDGGGWTFVGPRVTGYTHNALGLSKAAVSANGNNAQVQTANNIERTNDFPNAEFTDIIIRGITVSGVTMGADELHIYSLAAS